MKTLLTGFILCAMIVPCLAATETQEFDLSGITELEVDNSSGNVNVTAITNGKASVTANKKRFGENCKLTIQKKEKTLSVEVEKSGLFGKDCDVDFEIKVPKNVAMELETGSGEIRAKGTSGDVEFHTGSGSVHIEGEIKKLSGKTGSGDISITGLTQGGDLKVGSGSIRLSYDKSPTSGELDIKSGSGNAEVFFPQGTKLRTSFVAGSGELINEIGDNADGKFKVSMKTGSGNLHLKKR